jgi:hypothetical protein
VRWLPRTLVLALVLPRLALAQKAGQGESEVVHEGAFVVFSDLAELDKDRARSVVERVKAAYAFVAAEQGWSDDPVLAHDVGIRVVSDVRMKEISEKAKGVTLDKNTFAVAASLLDEERSARTIAHELTHLEDRRHLDGKDRRLPHWFKEGRAVAMGRAYEKKLGISDRRYDDSIARIGSNMTSSEAKRILEDEAFIAEKKMASVPRMEALGFIFLEFVRTHDRVANFEPKLAKVVVAVGRGATLEEAFASELKVKLEEARAAFYGHLER